MQKKSLISVTVDIDGKPLEAVITSNAEDDADRIQQILFEQIAQSLQRKQLDLAVVLAKAALKHYPDVVDYYKMLGTALFMKEDLWAAQHAFIQFAEKMPESHFTSELHAILDNLNSRIHAFEANLSNPFWAPLCKSHDEIVVMMDAESTNSQLCEKRTQYDFLAADTCILSDFFWNIKPDFYLITDRETMQDRMQELAAADWNMQIYVPHDLVQHVRTLLKKATVHGMASERMADYLEMESCRHLLEKGYATFGDQNNLADALSLALTGHYRKIWLAGADVFSLANITVDKYCRLCFTDKNGNCDKKKLHSIYDAFHILADIYTWLECIKHYAGYLETAIINLKLDSLIDTFPKGELGEEPYPWKK